VDKIITALSKRTVVVLFGLLPAMAGQVTQVVIIDPYHRHKDSHNCRTLLIAGDCIFPARHHLPMDQHLRTCPIVGHIAWHGIHPVQVNVLDVFVALVFLLLFLKPAAALPLSAISNPNE
jgi:hypothetical protein